MQEGGGEKAADGDLKISTIHGQRWPFCGTISRRFLVNMSLTAGLACKGRGRPEGWGAADAILEGGDIKGGHHQSHRSCWDTKREIPPARKYEILSIGGFEFSWEDLGKEQIQKLEPVFHLGAICTQSYQVGLGEKPKRS